MIQTRIQDDKNYKCVLILCSVIIVIVPLINIRSFCGLSLLNDEFGYWATAGYLNGFSWKDLIQLTPYYASGYGFLLSILLWIFPQPELAYKASIILNVVFLWISFYYLIRIGNLVFPDIKKNFRVLIATVSILIPQTLLYSQYSWPEPLLLLLYVSISYSMILLVKYRSTKYICGGIFACFILTIIHPRGQFILFLYVLMAAGLSIRHRSFVNAGLVTALGASSVIIGMMMKEWTLIHVWSFKSGYSGMNTISFDSTSVGGFINSIISHPNLFIISLMGKAEASLLTTGFVIVLPIIESINSCKATIFNKSKNSSLDLLIIWLVISFALMMVLTSIRTLFWMERKDNLVYMRYFDFCLIPLMFIGWGLFIQMKRNKYIYLAFGLIASLISFPYVIQKIAEIPTGFNYICSSYIGGLLLAIPDQNQLVQTVQIVQSILLAGTLILFLNQKWKTHYIPYVWMLLYAGMNGIIYFNVNNKLLENRSTDLDRIAEVVNYISNNSIHELDYLLDVQTESYPYDAKLIQFLNPELEINVITEFPKYFETKDSTVYLVNRESRKNYPALTSENADVSTKGLFLYDFTD